MRWSRSIHEGDRLDLARDIVPHCRPPMSSTAVARYRIIGMDCAKDAREIEEAAARIDGVADVRVSTATQIMTARAQPRAVDEMERAVVRLGYQLDPLAHEQPGSTLPSSHFTPAYRRALWIVVGLNVGYGAVEMTGGFISNSQALKADALDFLGDGAITFLGLLAINWGQRWRARSALIQGLFLGALGLGVIATTLYRLLAQAQPEAEIMGLLGVVALLVNVAAAIALIPHRTGDANARAVWLFSRNDAVGNAAVIVAAGLVAWTGTAWPDLVVAMIIATLFLQSSLSIVKDALRDLRLKES